jgi:hypothetical protein
MTALTKDVLVNRRGNARTHNEFAYPVKAGEIVYRGSLVALTGAGAIVRVQTAGAAVFLGVSDRFLDNTASAAVSVDKVTPQKGTMALTVPSATAANVGAAIYATDDGTVTLTNSGSLLTVGTLAGIDAGQTYVAIAGS